MWVEARQLVPSPLRRRPAALGAAQLARLPAPRPAFSPRAAVCRAVEGAAALPPRELLRWLWHSCHRGATGLDGRWLQRGRGRHTSHRAPPHLLAPGCLSCTPETLLPPSSRRQAGRSGLALTRGICRVPSAPLGDPAPCRSQTGALCRRALGPPIGTLHCLRGTVRTWSPQRTRGLALQSPGPEPGHFPFPSLP